MIDNDGFRPNVGIILSNTAGQVFWGKRIGQFAWQFPQGGIGPNENPKQALYRELQEETGLHSQQVKVLACTQGWLRYRIPPALLRQRGNPTCIGQKQKWFLLELLVDDQAIQLDNGTLPEFDLWRWVSYWYPVDKVVAFKQNVYRRALKELCPALAQLK
jgi:putative (di)nucleoside polyphosphate hydrolase